MKGLRLSCHMIEVFSRRAPFVFLLLFVAAASSTCGKKQETAASTNPPPVAAASESTAAPAAPAPQPAPTSPPDTAASAAAPPASAAAPPAGAAPTPASSSAIATSDGESPSTRVEVTELKRGSGGILSLKFIMINDSDKNIDFGATFANPDDWRLDFNSIGGVTLVDPVAKKKYFVVRDADKKCVCSSELERVTKGSRLNLWAKFPAPPEDVNKIGIVIPHFAPMDDVPISK
jgi:hypothetical protein